MKRVNLLLILPLLPFLLASCKTAKNQEAAASADTASEQIAVDKPVKISVAAIHLDTSAVAFEENKKSRQAEDSLFATIKRTPCYGRCPIYEAVIYKSGYTLYTGKQFVEKAGVFSTRISKNDLRAIMAKASEIGYFNLMDEYDSPVTDFPTTHTSLSSNGIKKEIKDRVGGPESLREYEKLLDSILDKSTWVKVGELDR